MPIGTFKNTLYGLALPLVGKRCEWKSADDPELSRVLRKHHVVGACVQRFEKGVLTDCHAVGYASLEREKQPVSQDTIFRTASIAKMVSALLVFRLQTLGRLNVQMEVTDLIGFPVRNPFFPDAPITLAMLLSHTSSIVDSQAYFNAFQKQTALSELLADENAFAETLPGTAFRYSNFAAGIVGCILEKWTGKSLEELAGQELFEPLGVHATFDASSLDAERTADSYRVLPAAQAFSGCKRIASAKPLETPDPQQHYLLASGNLYLTAADLAKLTLAAWNGASGFLDQKSLQQMQKPLFGWPEKAVPMRHGMGLLQLEDPRVCAKTLWGHQGFAYGAVNGVFFDAEGSGFVCLNSGASERRWGHLALINRDLIRWAFANEGSER